MDTRIENQALDDLEDSSILPKIVQNIVIRDSQISSGITRTALILVSVAALVLFGSRFSSSVFFRDALRTLCISLLSVAGGFMILGQMLDRALRRCPLCRTRITRKTEEEGRCLECETDLWEIGTNRK